MRLRGETFVESVFSSEIFETTFIEFENPFAFSTDKMGDGGGDSGGGGCDFSSYDNSSYDHSNDYLIPSHQQSHGDPGPGNNFRRWCRRLRRRQPEPEPEPEPQPEPQRQRFPSWSFTPVYVVADRIDIQVPRNGANFIPEGQIPMNLGLAGINLNPSGNFQFQQTNVQNNVQNQTSTSTTSTTTNSTPSGISRIFNSPSLPRMSRIFNLDIFHNVGTGGVMFCPPDQSRFQVTFDETFRF